MRIIKKKLIKIGFTKITNYEQLVNLGFPTLFTFKSDNQTYIGFTNQYKPSYGIIEFILATTNKQKIKDYMTNKITANQFFKSSNTNQYNFTKGKLTLKKIDDEKLKNVIPSEALTYDNPFNTIYEEK